MERVIVTDLRKGVRKKVPIRALARGEVK